MGSTRLVLRKVMMHSRYRSTPPNLESQSKRFTIICSISMHRGFRDGRLVGQGQLQSVMRFVGFPTCVVVNTFRQAARAQDSGATPAPARRSVASQMKKG